MPGALGWELGGHCFGGHCLVEDIPVVMEEEDIPVVEEQDILVVEEEEDIVETDDGQGRPVLGKPALLEVEGTVDPVGPGNKTWSVLCSNLVVEGFAAVSGLW